MNKTGKTILDTLLYLVTFVIIQLAIPLILVVGYMHFNPDPQQDFGNILTQNVTLNIASSIIGSLIVIALFIKLGWVSRSRAYLVSRPWTTLTWVAVATIGLIIPAAGLEELLKVELPEQLQLLFTRMMHQPLGYVAIGILAPLAEEMVFRGAILRSLLNLFGGKHWVAIVLSAAAFGAVHGNSAQFVHAFMLGLFLGWLFYRTGSIIPGIVLHWVNNTIVYVMANLVPGSEEATLSQLSGGRPMIMALYVFFSLCLLVPAIVQLNQRLRR